MPSSSAGASASDNASPATTVPLLSFSSDEDDRLHQSVRRQSLREAARLLRRAGSRRLMRERSMLVRETAAQQLEERQTDWAYSKPIVFLDLLWNFSFVLATASVLILSRHESPSLPLRIWILGYAFQCVFHMVCVFLEYRRRRRRSRAQSSSSGSPGDAIHYVSLAQLSDNTSSGTTKHLESANTLFSFIWWIIGFYWVSAGGQALARESPQLYWLSLSFLALDVFFVVFCVALACVVGIAVCCCLPCIIAILYAVADQEGASREEVNQLPKFKFRRFHDMEKVNGEIQGSLAGVITECDTEKAIEHVVSLEDAECCICLCTYDDGAELRKLPCSHHFIALVWTSGC